MAKIFLDANYLIDWIEKRRKIDATQFKPHILYTSPLSLLIYAYLYKIEVPNEKLKNLVEEILLLTINEAVVTKSLIGPTNDFEDNVQLHSAAEGECDCFLTGDKNLLKMKFFGKTKIAENLKEEQL